MLKDKYRSDAHRDLRSVRSPGGAPVQWLAAPLPRSKTRRLQPRCFELCESNAVSPVFYSEYRDTYRLLSRTGRAQAFEPSLLSLNQKALVPFLYPRDSHIRQAVSSAAVCAGKVRVALGLAAVVREFKVPGPSFDISLVHQADLHETLERSVDCHLVKSLLAQPFGDLLLRQRLVRLEQGL